MSTPNSLQHQLASQSGLKGFGEEKTKTWEYDLLTDSGKKTSIQTIIVSMKICLNPKDWKEKEGKKTISNQDNCFGIPPCFCFSSIVVFFIYQTYVFWCCEGFLRSCLDLYCLVECYCNHCLTCTSLSLIVSFIIISGLNKCDWPALRGTAPSPRGGKTFIPLHPLMLARQRLLAECLVLSVSICIRFLLKRWTYGILCSSNNK